MLRAVHRQNLWLLVVGVVGASLMAGCAANAGTPAASSSPTLPPKTSSAPATTSPAQRTNDVGTPLNVHGNIDKVPGQQAGIFVQDRTHNYVTFTVDSITADPPCDSGFAKPAQNGHYLAVALRVATSADFDEQKYGVLQFSSDQFKVIGPDGITVTSLGGNAYTCMAEKEWFPNSFLGPGQQYAGVVMLDSPATHGSLIYARPGSQTGWEWRF